MAPFGNALILPSQRIILGTVRRAACLLAACLGIMQAAGCEAAGPAGDPVTRTFSWFDYLGGGDLRRSCGAGASARWRFVYNAIWSEQVRTYDVSLAPRPAVEAHVFSGGIDLTYGDEGLFPAWFGRGARHELTDAEAAQLRRALEADVPEPLPVGSFLRSDNFYLTASRCVDGRFAFAAWSREQPGFERLPFLPALLPFDHTGRPVHPPRALDLGPFQPSGSRGRGERGEPPRFRVQVAADGVNR